MKIIRIVAQLGNDFTAEMECEHCGHRSVLTTGYDDGFYHDRVIPAMTCGSCGKNRAGVIPTTKNDQGTVHQPLKAEIVEPDPATNPLKAMMDLLTRGDLVRNIDNDHDRKAFIDQSIMITKVLKEARDALDHDKWHFDEPPPESGHYLAYWDTVASREKPNISSKFAVLFWCGGEWWAPVSESQPVIAWRPLPEAPQE